MLTIGLIGGVASGKSTVAGILAEQGARVFDADRHAHDVLDEPDVRDALVGRWGEEVLADGGNLDRQAVGRRVFGTSDSAESERKFLEELVHPRVRQRLLADLALHESAGGKVAVLDVPLLLEAGWKEDCDLLLMVDSSQKARLARATERGWDAQELANREAAQLPMKDKRNYADHVILNDDSIESLRGQTLEFWRQQVLSRVA